MSSAYPTQVTSVLTTIQTPASVQSGCPLNLGLYLSLVGSTHHDRAYVYKRGMSETLLFHPTVLFFLVLEISQKILRAVGVRGTQTVIDYISGGLVASWLLIKQEPPASR